MRIIIIFLVFLLISCSEHHDKEEIVIDIMKTHIDRIDGKFDYYRPNTNYYLDSVIKGEKPSYFFSNFSDYFNAEYYVESNNSKLSRKYYHKIDNKDNKVLLTLNNKKDTQKTVDFYLELKYGEWQIIDIIFSNNNTE
ncbi:hypothetical protein [Kordia sp.]|uniref:hypothetical protein n=1 Tax=Kordia sp. TaxID=1965332 RepID=UPI003B5B5094